MVVGAASRACDPMRATWLLRGRGSGTREATLSLLAQLQIEPPTLTLGSHGAVLAAAREGLGVTLIHGDAVGEHLGSGALRVLPVDGTPLDRPWHAITTRSPSPTTRLFLAHLLDPAQVGTDAFRQA